jgi:hypothetical protein
VGEIEIVETPGHRAGGAASAPADMASHRRGRGQTDKERVERSPGQPRRDEDRRQGGNRAVHQPQEGRLDALQEKARRAESPELEPRASSVPANRESVAIGIAITPFF